MKDILVQGLLAGLGDVTVLFSSGDSWMRRPDGVPGKQAR